MSCSVKKEEVICYKFYYDERNNRYKGDEVVNLWDLILNYEL